MSLSKFPPDFDMYMKILHIGFFSYVLLFTNLSPQIVSIGRKKFSADFQLMFRLLKMLMFLGIIVILVLLFLFLNLTVGDIFASLLAFLPTGWALLQVCILQIAILSISQYCSFHNEPVWNYFSIPLTRYFATLQLLLLKTERNQVSVLMQRGLLEHTRKIGINNFIRKHIINIF